MERGGGVKWLWGKNQWWTEYGVRRRKASWIIDGNIHCDRGPASRSDLGGRFQVQFWTCWVWGYFEREKQKQQMDIKPIVLKPRGEARAENIPLCIKSMEVVMTSWPWAPLFRELVRSDKEAEPWTMPWRTSFHSCLKEDQLTEGVRVSQKIGVKLLASWKQREDILCWRWSDQQYQVIWILKSFLELLTWYSLVILARVIFLWRIWKKTDKSRVKSELGLWNWPQSK